MGKLKRLSGQEVCSILAKHGIAKVRQRGSHIIMQRKIKSQKLDETWIRAAITRNGGEPAMPLDD